ncbi:MAG: YhjD/YihY/BrkB family envelope integrity protein [Candidatus Binataceae bacterium]
MTLGEQVTNYRREATGKLRALADPATLAIDLASTLQIAVLNFLNNNDLLWASALTYTVTLSIVPILALAFSVLKALGGTERVQPLIESYLALGNTQTTADLMHMVENVNPATLGSLGGAALLLTVISTLGTIENAFNAIWQVPSGRSYLRKFTDYLSLVFTIPLLLVAALTLTASFSNHLHAEHSLALVLPSLILWVGFFFLFVFFPYTKVRWTAAMLGSLFTAVLFQLAQWAYVRFWVALSSYQKIYGALATIPVLLLWIYLGWIIVLFGVEVCFAVQRGTSRYETLPRSLNFARYVTLVVLLRLADRFVDRHKTVNLLTLATELRLPLYEVDRLVEKLKGTGYVVEAAGHHPNGEGSLFLTIDPGQIKLREIFRQLETDSWSDPRIGGLLHYLEDAEAERLDALTLRDLQQGLEAAGTSVPEKTAEPSVTRPAAVRAEGS